MLISTTSFLLSRENHFQQACLILPRPCRIPRLDPLRVHPQRTFPVSLSLVAKIYGIARKADLVSKVVVTDTASSGKIPD